MVYELGVDVKLSEGDHGYIRIHDDPNLVRTWNEEGITSIPSRLTTVY
ncbi:MAG: hypothetical protein ACLTSJ_09955 [Alistipes communis]